MKLLTKKKYFDEIKAGKKNIDFRDAHITFVCEETGEVLRKKIVAVDLASKTVLPDELKESDMFEDDVIILFDLGVFDK